MAQAPLQLIFALSEYNEGSFRRVTCRLDRRSRDDCGDVIARCVGRGNSARDHWRSPFSFHSAWPVSFSHGQGRRLQSPQAARRWVDDGWSTCRWRDCRSDPGIVLTAQPCTSFSAFDHVDLRFVADGCVCNRALAGSGDELYWTAHRSCAPGYASGFHTLRFRVRTHAGNWFSISCPRKDWGSGLRIQSRGWPACFCAGCDWSCSYRWRHRVGSQTLSCCNL